MFTGSTDLIVCRNIPLEPGYVLCPPRGHGERNGKQWRASNPGMCHPAETRPKYTLVRFFLSKLLVVSAACREKKSKIYPSIRSPGKETPPLIQYPVDFAQKSRRIPECCCREFDNSMSMCSSLSVYSTRRALKCYYI